MSPTAIGGKLFTMRLWHVLRPVIAAALIGALPAFAVLTAPAMAQAVTTPILDDLFAHLKVAPNAAAAEDLDQQIWAEWMTPADPELRLRMAVIMRKRVSMDLGGAIADLQALVIEFPSYAEAWNQLATMHYMLNDYATSLADIEKVLQFEPRHFGALVGRAMIYRSQGKEDLAVKDMLAALALHPFLAERALFPELKDLVRA